MMTPYLYQLGHSDACMRLPTAFKTTIFTYSLNAAIHLCIIHDLLHYPGLGKARVKYIVKSQHYRCIETRHL